MKFWNYSVIMTGLSIILTLAGFPVADSLLSWIGFSTSGLSLDQSLLYLGIFGVSGILIGFGTGITIGFITKSSPENFIILPFIISMAIIFLIPVAGIVLTAKQFPTYIYYIVLTLMGIMSFGFIVSCVEFFRGSD